ncbi:MAG: PQQ-dependent sugar dehydrogenase [Planctomycetota bacterium]
MSAACAVVASSAFVSAQQIGTEVTASGLNAPIFAGSPAGDDRLFVLERGGAIRVIDNGTLQGSAFASGTGQTLNTGGEGGVLGLAFHPGFLDASSPGFGQYFINYTASNGPGGTPFDTVIEQVTVDNPLSNTPTIVGRETVLQFEQPFNNHNGGWIGFSPNDGSNLYIATGDGGSSNDPQNNAQNTTNLLGNILRIDIDGTDVNGAYSIPESNPFQPLDGPDADEIFAWGLRNPFRSSFDSLTGDLYIGDVGQNAREEISFIADGTSGQNFGWRLREGDIETPTGNVGGPAPSGAVDPLFDYAHGTLSAGRGSVTGGYVYRGSELPSQYAGLYFFADFVNSTVYTIDPANPDATFTDITDLVFPNGGITGGIVSFGEDANGELYIVDIGGTVFEIIAIPEPATIGLFGLGALGLIRRRCNVHST